MDVKIKLYVKKIFCNSILFNNKEDIILSTSNYQVQLHSKKPLWMN